MLDRDTFQIVVSSTPLVSVDLIVKKDDKILLGKRVNKPAKGYFFTMGGRILKNEKIKDGLLRVAKEELNISLDKEPKFIGIFEHFYHDSIFEDTSTHYVNIGYELEVESLPTLPNEQHTEYRWFTINELLKDKNVHDYVKDYFNGNKICWKI